MPSRASSAAFFVALLASALMLGPALAHAFELPAKIDLSREEYFIVQQIYRGWAGFSLVLVVQVIALLTAAFLARRERRVLVPTLLALFFVLSAQVLFWAYTYPANAATANWTRWPAGPCPDLPHRRGDVAPAGPKAQLPHLLSPHLLSIERDIAGGTIMANDHRNPRHQTQKMQKALADLQAHLRQDIAKVDEPQLKAIFETSAEVLGALIKTFRDYEQKNEAAWRRN